jgi:hypothetical protein
MVSIAKRLQMVKAEIKSAFALTMHIAIRNHHVFENQRGDKKA